ncbi:MAG: M56 family metallopeptidase [Deltaproteobacteria bacterium]
MQSALLAIIPVLSVTIAALAWAAFGLHGVLSFTSGVLELCQSLFVRCIEYKDALKLIFLWSGASLVFGGIVYGAAAAGRNLFRARQRIKGLSLYDNGGGIVVIKNDTLRLAFTHGFFRPRIYISNSLITSLDRNELLSVFFHELRHKKAKDPLRFFLIGFFKDCFFYIPLLRVIYANARAKAEIMADDFAASLLKEPLSLASALLKVASHNGRLALEGVSIAGGGGCGIAERVKRLIHGIEPAPRKASFKSLFLSFSVAVALIISFAWPVSARFHDKGPVNCTTGHCESHAASLGKDCKKHCEAQGHPTHSPSASGGGYPEATRVRHHGA